MKRLIAQLLTLIIAAAVGIVAVWATAGTRLASPDTAALNDAVHIAATAWPDLTSADLAHIPGEVTVTDLAGTVIASTAERVITSPLEAASQRALTAPVMSDDVVVALVYLTDDLAGSAQAVHHRVALVATVVIGAAALLAALALTFTYRRVIRPFHRLRAFATNVASGDLDAPLTMDRDNVFGAWTESFDLMRGELASAREREAAVQKSKRDLLAQISHDIRTPVASIAATAEVMATRATDPQTLASLEVITTKATQIDQLVADLFHAGESELAALTVQPTELTSVQIGDLIRATDYEKRARIDTIPDCIVLADPRRLTQVFDNIIANSYKYAGTAITVTSHIDGAMLVLDVSDSGPGVPAAELDTIFARGVRGSTVADIPGQGLGLFTVAYLMDRMGGDVAAVPTPHGFTIRLWLPLA